MKRAAKSTLRARRGKRARAARRLSAEQYAQALAPPAPEPTKARHAPRRKQPPVAFEEDPPLCPGCKRRDALTSVHAPHDFCSRCRAYQPGKESAVKTIHLLAPSLSKTCCGLDALELPREETTGIPGRATCAECKAKDLTRMLGNAERNMARGPLRGGRMSEERMESP